MEKVAKMAKVGVYLRVSTDAQDAKNQLQGITAYAKDKGLSVNDIIEDTASGRLSWRERSIGSMIDNYSKGDIILVAEISRLGRNTLQVLELLEATAKKGIAVHIVKQNLIFSGQDDIASTILATVLSMVAQIERDFISQRTKEALAKKKAEGVKLGRPKGKAKSLKLDNRRDEIIDYLQKGVSKRSIARIVDCSPATLYSWISRNDV